MIKFQYNAEFPRQLRQRLIKFTVLFLPDISRRLFFMRLFFTAFYLICQHPLPFLFICHTETLVDKDPDQPGLRISVVAQGMQLLECFHHRLLSCVRTVLVASQNGFRDPVKLPFILQDQIPEFFPVHTQSPLCCSVCFIYILDHSAVSMVPCLIIFHKKSVMETSGPVSITPYKLNISQSPFRTTRILL